MTYGSKKYTKILVAAVCMSAAGFNVKADDTIPSGFSKMPEFRIGAEVSGGGVIGTNDFLRGNNLQHKAIKSTLGGSIRADFSFNPETREGMLYRGLYQGIGVGPATYFANELLGNPVSLYVYQGAPIVHLNSRLWLGYEWQFGAAFGWKHYEKNPEVYDNNRSVSTPVTAHIGLGLKLNYSVTDRWQLSMGVGAVHYSNGNTSWPNGGVNTVGANIGIAYILNPQKESIADNSDLKAEADRHEWYYDIMAYGAWRKRAVFVGEPLSAELCPGKFGVLGLQFAPSYKLNRFVSIGPALDMQWDESAGLAPYWVDGSWDENIMFTRPPFGKQISVGASAHAELTMPIFSVNAGIGVNIINPKGDKRFYQSLTLKTFVTKNVYLNVGYRLGDFKDPQNLMLGVGVRL